MSTTPDTTDAATSQPSLTFGVALSDARNKRRLSVDDVAKELNILRRHIEAIESEDYAALPQRAFARGFVVSYAKFLNLDAGDIAKQFDQSYPNKQGESEKIKSPLKPMGKLYRDRSHAPLRLNIWLVLAVIAVIAIGIALLRMVGNATGGNDNADVAQTQVADSLSVTEQAQGAALGEVGATGSALNIGGETAAAGTESVAAPASIDLWVKETTIIKITDATGKVLLSGEQSRGGYQLSGQAPINLEIDNPTRVSVDFNKNPVRLSDYTNGDKASLTLQ